IRYVHIQRQSYINFHLLLEVDVLPQKLSVVIAALPDSLPVQRKPRAALLEQVVLGGEVKQVAFLRDPLAEQNIKFRLPKGRGHFVLNYFRLRAVADHAVAVLDGGNTPGVDSHGRVKLEGSAAGRGLG